MPMVSADALSMRNDLLRFLYTGMLLETPLADVKDFWLAHPLEQGTIQYGDADVLKAIWQDEHKLSLAFHCRALNDLEPFLNERGINAVDFIRKTTAHLQGMIISPKSTLLWSKQFLKHVHVTRDTRALMLQAAEEYTWNLAPGLIHRCLRTEMRGDRKESLMLLMGAAPNEETPRSKRVFAGGLPAADYELWTVMMVQAIPLVSELPRYEEYRIHADCRELERILGDSLEINGDDALLRDEKIARRTTVHEFLRSLDIDPAAGQIPDMSLWQAIKDWECPVRKRKVIHRQCVYGSPVFLYALTYRPDLSAADTPLSAIIEGALGKTGAIMFRLRQLHEKLIDSVTARARIVYHAEDESISINGAYLIKFVPAKIFRRMIREFIAEGRRQFNYKEFVHDPDIIVDTSKPNLTVRIERLAQALENTCPHIIVERPKPGVVALNPRCKIDFCEEA